jgi:hypothetical protein
MREQLRFGLIHQRKTFDSGLTLCSGSGESRLSRGGVFKTKPAVLDADLPSLCA